MIRACAVAALVLASCASSALVTSSSSPSPPASTAEILKCSSDRLVFLVEQFFARYNARDLDGFLGLFNWTSPAGGGGFSSYFDDPGQPQQFIGSRVTLRLPTRAVGYRRPLLDSRCRFLP